MNNRELNPEGPDPVSNPDRLQELANLDIFHLEENPGLQSIVKAASTEFNLPISLVTIVMDGAQYFLAMHGLDGWLKETRGTPSEWSFCINTVRSQQPFVVEDATAHPLVRENPLTTIEGIRCYAGVPLMTSNGHALGAFCVIGASPRNFSEVEVKQLGMFAKRAVEEIEKLRFSLA